MQLAKLFGSKSRTKILEKFVIENVSGNGKTGFFIRELCRDLDEQINSVRRELMNLEDLGILRSKEENKKKVYFLNRHCPIYPEITEIFLKNYDPIGPIEEFFKGRKTVSLVTVSEGLKDLLSTPSNRIVDIFIIGEIDRIEFNNFLERAFFGRKIKYAAMSQQDFEDRLEYNDKLIVSILSQKDIKFLRDKIGVREMLVERLASGQ